MNKLKARPLKARGNFVIIRPDPMPKISQGGIHLVSETETDVRGTIYSVGPGVRNEKGEYIETGLTVGQKVYFHPGAALRIQHKVDEESTLFVDGKEVKKGGVEEFFVCKEYDCFAEIVDE